MSALTIRHAASAVECILETFRLVWLRTVLAMVLQAQLSTIGLDAPMACFRPRGLPKFGKPITVASTDWNQEHHCVGASCPSYRPFDAMEYWRGRRELRRSSASVNTDRASSRVADLGDLS